ncbi:MAG: ABC transporter permease [Candidatus Dormibacteraceae bacterium]
MAVRDRRLTLARPSGVRAGEFAWNALPVFTGIILLLLWEVGVRSKLPAYVARPSTIAAAIPSVVVTGSFWSDMLSTCGAIVEGVAIGSVAGAVLGLLMGRVREVGWFFTPYIRGLYSLPLIALIPVLVLVVGYNDKTRMVVIILSAFLPVAMTTADGARAVSKSFLDVGRTFGAKPYQVWFGIAFPASLPHILAGIDIALGRAFTSAVAVEVLASVPGLGYTLYADAQSLHDDVSFVYVVALAAFAILVRTGVRSMSGRLAPWYRPRARA